MTDIMNTTACQYGPFALFFIIAVLFSLIILNIGILFRPNNPKPEKAKAYECGNEPVGEANRPVLPRYYFFAILLVLFDIEAVFLIPWALSVSTLGYSGLAAVGLFFAVLMGGYVFIWRKGDLNWD